MFEAIIISAKEEEGELVLPLHVYQNGFRARRSTLNAILPQEHRPRLPITARRSKIGGASFFNVAAQIPALYNSILAVKPGDCTSAQSLDRAVRAWRKQRQAAEVAAHEGESVFAILAGSAGAQMRSLHGVQHRRVRRALERILLAPGVAPLSHAAAARPGPAIVPSTWSSAVAALSSPPCASPIGDLLHPSSPLQSSLAAVTPRHCLPTHRHTDRQLVLGWLIL
jgi:hypothetical protein